MKKYIYKFTISLLVLGGCNLIDPTEIINPNLTEEAVLATDNSMKSWIAGCERQVALLYNAIIVNAEIASDNYENTQTYYNQHLDKLNIIWTDKEIDDLQYAAHRLREMAVYGIETVKEADLTTTDDDLAKLHFFKGLSSMILSEYFSSIPGEPGGEVLTAAQHRAFAIASFTESLDLATTVENTASALLGRARANYYGGNKANAVADAQAAITASSDFLKLANYDQVNLPLNRMQSALYDRGTFDDLQPLPRLDFLDPKYSFISANEASSAPIQKIEEAYLILAEAAAVDQDFTSVRNSLNSLLDVVDGRDKRTFLDNNEDRSQKEEGSRPDNDQVSVAASEADALINGLVINRKGDGVSVTVPVVSGTSVTPTMIDAITTEDQALEIIYLMRQEIFIAEGRRMVDMGIRLVVSENEVLANENLEEGNSSTLRNLPSFIDAIKTELDAFTYDKENNTCVITHNLNKILVQNKASNDVLPFN